MRILVKKGNFEFEIDGERIEDYLTFRYSYICDVDYMKPFFADCKIKSESVGHNFILLWTFVGLFIGYGYDYVFMPLRKIVDIFNNNKKLIIDWNKVKKIKFAWLEEFYYAMNLKIDDIKLRLNKDIKESIKEDEESRHRLYFEIKEGRRKRAGISKLKADLFKKRIKEILKNKKEKNND